jgi:hypothetical protein
MRANTYYTFDIVIFISLCCQLALAKMTLPPKLIIEWKVRSWVQDPWGVCVTSIVLYHFVEECVLQC